MRRVAVVESRKALRADWCDAVRQSGALCLAAVFSTWQEFAGSGVVADVVFTSSACLRRCPSAAWSRTAGALRRAVLVLAGEGAGRRAARARRVRHLPADASGAAMVASVAARSSGGPTFSGREKAVVAAIGKGESLKSIASALDVSSGTIQSYRRRAMRKLSLQSTADLIKFVAALGLCDCPCRRRSPAPLD